jgi:hypothetical protein
MELSIRTFTALDTLGLVLFYATPLAVYHFKRSPAQRQRIQRFVSEVYLQWQPVFVVLVWGCAVVWVKSGMRFGLGLLLVGPSVTVALWAVGSWRGMGWSPVGTSWNEQGLLVTAANGALLLVALWLVLVLALAPFAPVALAWLFFCLQMIPLCLERVDANAESRLLISVLFATASATAASATTTPATSTAESMPAVPETVMGVSGGVVGTSGCVDNPSPTPRWRHVVFVQYKRRLQSFLVLLVYVVWSAVAAPPAQKHVGLVTALAVLVVDGVMAAALRCPSMTTPATTTTAAKTATAITSTQQGSSFQVLLLQALVRGALAAAGTRYWFLGHCAVFLALGAYLVKVVLHSRMLALHVSLGMLDLDDFTYSSSSSYHSKESSARKKHQAEIMKVDNNSSSSLSVSDSGGASGNQVEQQQQLQRSKGYVACFFGPKNESLDVFLLGGLSCAFLIEVALVGLLLPGLHHVHWQGGEFSQWSVGLVVLGLLLGWGAVLFVVEMEQVDDIEARKAERVKRGKALSSSSDSGSASKNASSSSAVDTAVMPPPAVMPDTASSAVPSSPFSFFSALLFKLPRRFRVALLLVLLASIGALLFAATKAYALLATFLCAPTALVAALSLFEQWKLRDYHQWDSPNALPPRARRNTFLSQTSTATTTSTSTSDGSRAPNVQEAEDVPPSIVASTTTTTKTALGFFTGAPICGGSEQDSNSNSSSSCSSLQLFIQNWRKGDFRRVFFAVALVRCGLSTTDAITVATQAVFTVALVAWGAIADVGWRLGWLFPCAFLEVFFASWAYTKWYDRYKELLIVNK